VRDRPGSLGFAGMGDVTDMAAHHRAAMRRSRWHKLTRTPVQIWRHPPNRGQRLRRVAGWAAWQVWERTVRHPWQVGFGEGLTVTLHPHDFITSGVLYLRVPDHELMPFARAWMAASGDTFVDAGANVGLYSLFVAQPGVRAVAFEPGGVAFARAHENVRRNGLGQSIATVRAALGDIDGRTRLTTRWGGMNYVVGQASSSAADTEWDAEEVPMTRLDTFDACEGLGRVALIKVDVEGYELPVLRGAGAVIARDHPALIVEANDVPALRRFAAQTGYAPVRFDPVGGTVQPRKWPSAPPDNVILVPDVPAAQALLASPDNAGPRPGPPG
jgi:FkbM family methyltransferase